MLYRIELKNNKNIVIKIYYIFNNLNKIKLYKFVYKILNIDLFKYKNKNEIEWLDEIRNDEMDRIKKNIIDY